ncbi:hypothetical protein EP7_004868 [Isosphaeraceae bacterium EP7]
MDLNLERITAMVFCVALGGVIGYAVATALGDDQEHRIHFALVNAYLAWAGYIAGCLVRERVRPRDDRDTL